MSNKNLSINKKTVFYFLIYVFICCTMYIFGLIFGSISTYENVLGALSIAACCWVAYRFRKNTSLFICFFFVAYAVYSIVFGAYYFPEMRPDWMYSQFHDHSVYTVGIQCIFLYSISMVYFVENGYLNNKIYFDNSERVSYNDELKPNWLIVFGCIIVIVYISLTEFVYHGSSSRASITPLYEYRAVFFIAGMIHSRRSKFGKYLWAIVVLFGALPSLIGGNRAEAIPLIIAYIFFYFDDIDSKKIFPLIIAAVLLMIASGMFRQTLFSGEFSFGDLWSKISNEKFAFDTAYWAYPPSLASIAVSSTDGFKEKIELFFYQILYIFAGGKYVDKQLTSYTRQAYANLGGYVSPVYLYYWIGLLSPILFGILVYEYIKLYDHVKFKKMRSMLHHDLYAAVSAYFVATVPRWFLYGPFSLIRGEAIMAIGILLASTVSLVMFKRNIKV